MHLLLCCCQAFTCVNTHKIVSILDVTDYIYVVFTTMIFHVLVVLSRGLQHQCQSLCLPDSEWSSNTMHVSQSGTWIHGGSPGLLS
jgi:hypothetical protein